MRAAATVLLLRETAGALEVLMVRRHAAIAFMGGMWVFPGGRLDEADAAPDARRRLPAGAAARMARLRSADGGLLAEDAALALHVAACRETFEEAGVLLARDASGEPCAPGRVAALQERRCVVERDSGAFLKLLEAEDLYLDVGALVYWSHWITPSFEPKRYDTRFFAIRVPAGQEVSADLSETTEAAWVRPAGVHEAIERGEMRIVPPTLYTLEDLADSHAAHGGLDAMLVAEHGRATPPVMPRIEAGAEGVRVVMPWDPGYAAISGEGLQPAEGFPPHLACRRSSMTLRAR